MKNLVFNLRTAKAQAEGCAKVTKSSRMAKILTTLTLLLTLGVGQMWAWFTISSTEDIYFDATDEYTRWNLSSNKLFMKIYYGGTSSANVYEMTKINGTYLYYCGSAKGHDNVSGIEFFAGANSSTYTYGTGQCSFSGWSSALSSLKEMCYHTASSTNWNWGTRHTTNPPLNTISLAKYSTTTYGGDGTNANPYLVAAGTKAQVQVSSKKRSSNLTAKYKFTVGSTTDGNYTTTTTKTVVNSAVNGTDYTAYVKGWGYSGDEYSYRSLTSNTVYFRGVNVYSVTYNDNGSTSGSIPSESGTKYVSGSNITLATNSGSLAKTNYTFKGWNTEPDGNGTHYNAGGTLSNISANTTLYAEWAPDWALYNGSTLLGVFSKVSSTQYTLSVDLSRANHHQLQFKKDGATGYIVGAEDPTSTFRNLSSSTGYFDWANIPNVVTGTYFITLKYESSTWKYKAEQKYTLTYDANGATSGTAPVDASSPYMPNAAITTAANSGSLAKSSFNFTGWNTQPDGQGTHYNVSTANAFNITANTTLYAEWTPNVPSSACLAGDFGSVTMNKSTSGSTTTFTYTFYDKAAGTYNFYLKDCSSSTALLKATSGVSMTQTGCTSIASTGASNYYFRVETGAAGDITITATYNTSAKTINMDVTRVPIDAVTPSWWLIGDAAIFTNWNTDNHNYPLNRSYRGMSNVFYRVVDFGGNTTAYFKPLKGNTRYGHNEGGGNKTVVTGTQYAITNTDADGTAFKANGQGVVWCVVDQTNKKFWEQTPTTYYTITLANGSSGDTGNGVAGTEGTVTLTTNNLGNLKTKQYASGERVNISVSAKTGYYIDDITIGATSVATDVLASSYSGYTTMPSGNTTLTVTYKPIYSVTFGVGTDMSSYGSVSNNLSISSGTKVLTGTSITFTATPNLGYKFVGWYSDAACTASVSTDNPYTVNVTSATTLYAKFAVRNLYIHADFISNWATPAQMTQSTVNRAIYTYTINNMAILASAQVGDAWNTGYHFHFVNTVANPNDNKAYNYNGVQTPTYSGSSIDGVHKTHTDNPTIEFGLTRKSNVTITLTLKSIDDATKPTLNIAADPIYTITHGDPTHGSYTIKVGSASAVGTSTESVATTTITLAATPATGYHFDHWTVTKAGGGTVTVTSNRFTMPSDDVTVAATFLPTSYDVTLKANGGSGADKVVSATYDAAMPSILKGGGTLTAHSRTGYNFAGYYDDASTGTQYYTNVLGSARAWDKASATNLFAHWSAKTYTITLTQSGETGYGSSGTASVTATYDAALPTIASLPTAAQGYAFMGYYTGHNGTGTQYYGPTGNKLVATYTTAGGIKLFAYFKKAEITDITLDNYMFDPVAAGGTGFVIANPTIAPTPVLPVKICWELLYDNGNSVPAGHEAIDDHDGSHPDRVKFSIAGLAAGGYKIKATLALGSTCPALPADVLSEREVSFTIASGYTVTIQYKDTEGNTIAPSTTSPGKATNWTSISAPTIVGYNFSTWVPGDGITLESSATTNSNRFKATFNGTLTARYTKKRVIYFNNTLGWSNVYVYFYSSNKYWADNYGTGAYAGKYFDGYKPYSDQRHGHMTQIEGTNIWYFDYTAAGYDTYENIAFANMDKSNSGTDNTSNNNLGFFSNTPSDPIQVVRRGDHNASLPMFVPLAGQPKTKLNNNKAEYSNQGYWMNYPENTGYALRLFNSSGVEIDSIPFEFTPDKTMPMSVEYILDGSKTYQFKLYRTDGKWFGNNGTMKAGASGDIGETSWEFKEKDGETTRNNCQIKTNAAGTYTFTLDFGNKDGYNYLIGVHYPAAANDFQILYNDNAEWSLGSTHDENWVHPSRIIRARENGVDTISFFVAKDNTPILKARKVSSINASTGAITWGSLNINGAATQSLSVDSSAVYNFKVTQGAAGVINSIQYIGAYTGNYYIRSSALSNKWGNYVDNLDHRMTYSSFSESNANSFGEKYSHYKAKWCPRNTNIAFCIANDYSPCITDTLKQDVGNPYNNTDTEGTLKNDGDAGHSGNNAYLDRYSANVRFMWDRKTNKISRAYVSASTSTNAKFLVLQGSGATNANIYDGSTGASFAVDPPGANSVILSDNENWIYEVTVKANPSALVKLYANYCGQTQWFRGAAGGFTEGTTAIQILGGSASASQYSVRVIYDFKTNRLVCAWVPSGSSETIDTDLTVNADVMIVREHQESAQCITFSNNAKMTSVKNVYGVMRFNRWILNNRQHPEDQNKDHARADHIVEDLAEHHPPLSVGQQKSTYERRLYFISFPFDVLVGDIFGFGTYGQYWVIQYYDGLNRAKKGYWMDSKPNWKYVSPTEVAQGYKLEKNQGYILELNLSAMAADNTTFWSNGISTIELYFPSTVNQDILKQTDITIPALSDEYECTINRGTAEGDRRVKDSYWRCIGVPSYNLYNSTLKDGSGNDIRWKTDYTWQEDESEFPFIYMWNKTDNTLTPQSTSAFLFQPMHAYLTQIKNAIVWTAVSAKPSSIVARRARKEATKEYNWRIELKQDTTFLDQTYVRMTNLEQVTDNFDFGQDLIKELNSRSNIYTFIGYEKVAANSMTLHTDQTTVIPVGANITTEGDYTFALPDGADGIGVTLIDEETGTRTNLSAGMDYTVYLEKGTHDNRFWLEISPVQQTPTDIELINGENGDASLNGVRKVLIDGILYIVKDGKLFDARGARVE